MRFVFGKKTIRNQAVLLKDLNFCKNVSFFKISIFLWKKYPLLTFYLNLFRIEFHKFTQKNSKGKEKRIETKFLMKKNSLKIFSELNKKNLEKKFHKIENFELTEFCSKNIVSKARFRRIAFRKIFLPIRQKIVLIKVLYHSQEIWVSSWEKHFSEFLI